MTTNVPKNPAPMPSDFAEAYAGALGHILRFREESANHGLNATLKLAGSFKAADNAWVTIHQDLADTRTQNLLYGDYLSDSSHPWIKDSKTLGMIVRHAAMLGEEKTVVANFVERTEQAYGTRPDAASLRLVA